MAASFREAPARKSFRSLVSSEASGAGGAGGKLLVGLAAVFAAAVMLGDGAGETCAKIDRGRMPERIKGNRYFTLDVFMRLCLYEK
jgi:hypothetical protein